MLDFSMVNRPSSLHGTLGSRQVLDRLRCPRPPPVWFGHGCHGHRDGCDLKGRHEAARYDAVENLEVTDVLL